MKVLKGIDKAAAGVMLILVLAGVTGVSEGNLCDNGR